MPRLPNHLRRPLTTRFQNSLVVVAGNATPPLVRAFDDLDNYDEDAVEKLAVAAAPKIQAVKTAVVRQAVGYYSLLSGVRAPAIAIGEVAAVATMRDPFISVWRALQAGNAFPDAVAAGRARLEAVVSNFTNSTARQTGDLFVAKANLHTHGWERQTNAGACAWCEEVAGAVYGSADSADFGHDRCGCSAVPIFE